jgi:hypothetical protein
VRGPVIASACNASSISFLFRVTYEKALPASAYHDPLPLAAAAGRCCEMRSSPGPGRPRSRRGARGPEEAPAVPKIRTGAANGPASSRDGIGRFDGERDN